MKRFYVLSINNSQLITRILHLLYMVGVLSLSLNSNAHTAFTEKKLKIKKIRTLVTCRESSDKNKWFEIGIVRLYKKDLLKDPITEMDQVQDFGKILVVEHNNISDKRDSDPILRKELFLHSTGVNKTQNGYTISNWTLADFSNMERCELNISYKKDTLNSSQFIGEFTDESKQIPHLTDLSCFENDSIKYRK